MTLKETTFNPQVAKRQLEKIADLVVEENAPLAPLTRMHAGGPADILAFPHTQQSAALLVRLCLEENWPLTVLGKASNVLVSDQGVRGVTLMLSPSLGGITKEGTKLTVGAGVPLYEVSAFAARHSLSGFEFAQGIPGSMGGAIFMNAGAFDGSISKVVVRTRFIGASGEISEIAGDEHDFSYRHSYFSVRSDTIILESELLLEPFSSVLIYEKMAELAERRYKTQPLEMYSAGSAFRRPEGYFAGKLITDAGMKGYTRAKAGVSKKHAGFIVNYGGASAHDILQIFRDVRRAVFEMEGVVLEPEVRLVGEWEDDPFNMTGER